MGLRAIDIRQVRRLSLRDIKPLTPPTPPVPQDGKKKPIEAEKPYTRQDHTYSRFAAQNSLLEALVDTLGLVYEETGQKPLRIALEGHSLGELVPGPPEWPKMAINGTTQDLLRGERTYTRAEIVELAMGATGGAWTGAEEEFTRMLQGGVIEPTFNPELFYLAGSTPF